MVMTDPIADMLTRIRNANQMKHPTVDMPASKLKKEILELLKKEGYIISYRVVKGDVQDTLRVTLKYLNNTRVVKGLKRISKPYPKYLFLLRRSASTGFTDTGLEASFPEPPPLILGPFIPLRALTIPAKSTGAVEVP